MMNILSINDHNRDIAGLRYIYPVLSRRAGGLSIGINFNTNNACNWRCIYCQVPNLTRGSAPKMDFSLLEDELRFFLQSVLQGDFYQRFQLPEAQQQIKDIAISGNGEPTSLKEFAKAIDLIGQIASELNVFPCSRYVLITNGSLIHQTKVQTGLKRLNEYGGEVWFKLDSATQQGQFHINNTQQSYELHIKNLLLAEQYCLTKLQICLFSEDDKGLTEKERFAFLNLLMQLKMDSAIQTIMLYTLARPSLQAEASRLSPLPAIALNQFADEIRQLGFEVLVSI